VVGSTTITVKEGCVSQNLEVEFASLEFNSKIFHRQNLPTSCSVSAVEQNFENVADIAACLEQTISAGKN